jgi:hypothetical protein
MSAERGGTTRRNAGFEEMSGEAVHQRLRMHVFPYSRSLGGFLTCTANRFRVDRLIPAVLAVAWKQPGNRSSPQAVTMCTEFFE